MSHWIVTIEVHDDVHDRTIVLGNPSGEPKAIEAVMDALREWDYDDFSVFQVTANFHDIATKASSDSQNLLRKGFTT